MLPEPSLDNEEFEMIMEEARTQIAGLYPEWTDFNYHDPGITLIELFSWLKESRQFYLDQISDEMRKRYLKLLGLRLRHRTPSRAVVSVPVEQDVTVLKGTRLWAGTVCFEAEDRTLLMGGGVTACFSASDRILSLAGEPESSESAASGRRLSVELFGGEPKPGNCFYIAFSHALPGGEPLRLYLELTNRLQEVRTQPLGKMAAPLARLCLQFYSEGDWREASRLEDETQGGIFSGFLHFVLPEAMEQAEVFGRRGYYLRLLLAEEEYDAPPIVDRISVNAIMAVQRETLIEAVGIEEIGIEEIETERAGIEETEIEETGIEELDTQAEMNNTDCPDLLISSAAACRFRACTMAALNGKNELYLRLAAKDGTVCFRYIDCFEKECDLDTGETQFEFSLRKGERHSGLLLVNRQEKGRNTLLGFGNGFPFQRYELEDEAVEYDRFSLLIREEDGYFYSWDRREDFSCSGPEDRHFTLDAERGTVCFGDCINGMAPEGEIRIISYARTLGRLGNVKSHAIDRFEGLSPEELPVWNTRDSVGGRDEETVDEGLARARRELKSPDTAVTDQDYERLVMETPGLLLETCKVITGAGAAGGSSAYGGTAYGGIVGGGIAGSSAGGGIMGSSAGGGIMGSSAGGGTGGTGIYIVVKPLTGRNRAPGAPMTLSSCYRENILRYLEPHRMAGRNIILLAPELITFDLYADLVLKPQYVEAEELVQKAVRDYFLRLGGRFGAEVSYSACYGMLDMLPYVAGVHSLTLDARGNGIRRRKDKTIVLPPAGLAVLGEARYLFTAGE